MSAKRKVVWEDLAKKMSAKRTGRDGQKATGTMKGPAPHEIIVQRLSSEPDNKQTYKPIQPREFVSFEYKDLTLLNLKKACATHFNLPCSTCDVLVSNKGPSCTNINQIPYRKDKVYLVRFALLQDQDNYDDDDDDDDDNGGEQQRSSEPTGSSLPLPSVQQESVHVTYPSSISIDELLKAGRLVVPKPRTKVVLEVEKFDMHSRQWELGKNVSVMVDDEKFSSGGFRDAFMGIETSTRAKKWVLKKYNNAALKTIEETLGISIEAHTRKQVQMHSVASAVTRKFSSKVPKEFGKCFSYNSIFYTKLNNEPTTIEEFVEGTFSKHINNNGENIDLATDSDNHAKTIHEKAQSLVHFSYVATDQKMMLLDIQGSGYNLYDPEIATKELFDEEDEIYFCCGNLSSIAIDNFVSKHTCNKYCAMLRFKQ